MHLLKPTFAIVIMLSLLWATPCKAWGSQGHRIVGALADLHLQPSLRKRYQTELGISDLAGIANWADQVKRERSQGPWHYLNLPPGERDYQRERDCPQGQCVLEKIFEFSTALKKPGQSQAKRKEALMYLVHFVGDLHQPLHVGYAQDRGGNDVVLNFREKKNNLHALWDEELLPVCEQDISHCTRNLYERISPKDITHWTESSVTDWARESRVLVLEHVYAFENRDLSQSYLEKSREIAAFRLSQAGIRLAHLLSDLLK